MRINGKKNSVLLCATLIFATMFTVGLIGILSLDGLGFWTSDFLFDGRFSPFISMVFTGIFHVYADWSSNLFVWIIFLYGFGSIMTAIGLFLLMPEKLYNLITISAATLFSSAIFFLPILLDWNRYPVRAPVLFWFSIVVVLIAAVLFIVRIVLRIKQKKANGDLKLWPKVLTDCALFFCCIPMAILLCDLIYDWIM